MNLKNQNSHLYEEQWQDDRNKLLRYGIVDTEPYKGRNIAGPILAAATVVLLIIALQVGYTLYVYAHSPQERTAGSSSHRRYEVGR